eukprot:9889095-Alexandrium_andersonii.AAC.1
MHTRTRTRTRTRGPPVPDLGRGPTKHAYDLAPPAGESRAGSRTDGELVTLPQALLQGRAPAQPGAPAQ